MNEPAARRRQRLASTVFCIKDRQPLIEDVLTSFAPCLGPASAAYRGHAYRVYNLARAIVGSARLDDELALASAFHDLGIWSDGTFDYLPPSIRRAREHVRARGLAASSELVCELIENHHRLGRLRGGAERELVAAFRKADLIDLSGGLLGGGVPRELIRDLEGAFPYAGFHGVLLRTAVAWFVRHPLRPLPMLR